MIVAFWSGVGAVVFTYLVMPVVVLVRGALVRCPVATAPITPPVSVVIAAHNEEVVIAKKIANVLACDYPSNHLEVVVASDGSTDGTAQAARAAALSSGGRVRVLDLPRVGKAAALNAAIAETASEVLVFTDANSMLEPDAVRMLVRSFADAEVGGVAGDQRYEAGQGATGERRYWSFDRALKIAESRAGNTISATGALYAIRRELVGTIVAGVTDDFATSTAVICAGRRLVFEPEAVAIEPPAASDSDEFARKVRIMTRGLRGVALRRELLDPRRHGFYAVQLLWHKLLRRLVAVPLVVVAVAAPVVAMRRGGLVYRGAAAAQLAFYTSALAGWAGRERLPAPVARLAALPAYFCMVNVAALRAAYNVVTRRRVDRWETARSPRGE